MRERNKKMVPIPFPSPFVRSFDGSLPLQEKFVPTKIQIKRQAQTDLMIKKMLGSKGDDETKPHTIDHSFIAEEASSLAELAYLAALLKFLPGVVNPVIVGNDARKFELTLQSSIDSLAIHKVLRESILMCALAEAFGAEYNGWGSSIVKADAT